MTESAPFRTNVAIRWSDFDQYGHANNTAFLEYAPQARLDFVMRGLGGGAGMPAAVVRRLEIDYVRAILPDTQEVVVETEIINFGRTSFTLRQTISDQHDHIVAVLETVMVMFDLKTAKAVELSPSARRELERFAAPAIEDNKEDQDK